MTFAEKIYLPAIFTGMGITGKHAIMTLTGKLPTVSYPEEKREFSKIYRGHHVLKRDDEGRERCTACGLCAVACPAEAITMKAAERKPEENCFCWHGYRCSHMASMGAVLGICPVLLCWCAGYQ